MIYESENGHVVMLVTDKPRAVVQFMEDWYQQGFMLEKVNQLNFGGRLTTTVVMRRK